MIYDICLYKKDQSGELTALSPPYQLATDKNIYIEQLLYAYASTTPESISEYSDPYFGSPFLVLCRQYYSAGALTSSIVNDLFSKTLRDFVRWYYTNILVKTISNEHVVQIVGNVTSTIENNTMKVQFQLNDLDGIDISCKYQFSLQ